MELELEILEAKTQRRGESTISFSRKSGTITLSATFCREIDIKHGDRLAIAKDPKREKDWYLVVFTKKDDPKGLQCRNNENTGVMFNCSSYAHAFMDQWAKKEDRSLKVALGTAPNPIMNGRANAYAILTKTLE